MSRGDLGGIGPPGRTSHRGPQDGHRRRHRGPQAAAAADAAHRRRLVLPGPLRPRRRQPGPGMQVPPHPHIGLQTASWLFQGLVLHRDSLGSRQLIRPGELNLMTAGRGIAHSEESAAAGPRCCTACSCGSRCRSERPARRTALRAPRRPAGGARGRRERDRGRSASTGASGPRPRCSPRWPGSRSRFPAGTTSCCRSGRTSNTGWSRSTAPRVVAGALIAPGLLAHLPAGRSGIRLSPAGGRRLARFFVLGGVPFGERLLMWWNFVARTREEIARAREDWVAGPLPGGARLSRCSPLAAPAAARRPPEQNHLAERTVVALTEERNSGHGHGSTIPPLAPEEALLARDRLVGRRDQRGRVGEYLLLGGEQPGLGGGEGDRPGDRG